jgi:CBS domain-containing protein
MITVMDIMHSGVQCVSGHQSIAEAARLMRDLDVGALPVCDNDVLKGIITDRDIVLKCVAEGRDPATVPASELARGRPQTIEADEDISRALMLMEENKVRRLPVIEHPSHKLVGMISEADVARHLPEAQVAELVAAICAE